MNSQHCPICDCAATVDLSAYHELALDQAPKRYSIMSCSQGCGLRWMTPYPQPEDYQDLYNDAYYEQPQANCTSYAEEKNELAACYATLARKFCTYKISGTLLDIGCGTGSFLSIAQAHGINAEGIEPSEYASTKAKEKWLKVKCGILNSETPAQSYQAAYCSHVLEHVPDAHAFMHDLQNILTPGAPIYIEVPLQFTGIIDILKRHLKKRETYSIYSIHHHYFFTPKSIALLLKKHGFEIISITTFLPSRRATRKGFRARILQSLLWTADLLANRGDVISVWARRV